VGKNTLFIGEKTEIAKFVGLLIVQPMYLCQAKKAKLSFRLVVGHSDVGK
jgi:hypothetical protein